MDAQCFLLSELRQEVQLELNYYKVLEYETIILKSHHN